MRRSPRWIAWRMREAARGRSSSVAGSLRSARSARRNRSAGAGSGRPRRSSTWAVGRLRLRTCAREAARSGSGGSRTQRVGGKAVGVKQGVLPFARHYSSRRAVKGGAKVPPAPPGGGPPPPAVLWRPARGPPPSGGPPLPPVDQPLPLHQHGTGHEDGGVGARDHANPQAEDEIAQRGTAEEVEDDQGDDGAEPGGQRAHQHL